MTTPATPARFGTWLRVLLVVSLALNVAVAAGFAWHHFNGHEGRRDGHRMLVVRGAMMPNPRVLRAVLSEERQAVVDAVLAEHRLAIRSNVREVFQARTAVHDLMTADTIDRAALDRAFADLRARDAEAATAVQAMLTDLVTELTPEERRALAEAVHRRHPRMRVDKQSD